MDIALDDLAEIQRVARTILTRADLVSSAVARARTALERIGYECDAARRQRAEMADIASRAQAQGDALTHLAVDLLRRCASFGSASQ